MYSQTKSIQAKTLETESYQWEDSSSDESYDSSLDSFEADSSEYIDSTNADDEDLLAGWEDDLSDFADEMEPEVGAAELGEKIRDMIVEVQSSEAGWEEKQPLLADLLKARNALELGKKEEAVELFQSVEDGFSGVQENQAGLVAGNKEECNAKLDELSQQIESSKCKPAKKAELRSQVQSMRLRLTTSTDFNKALAKSLQDGIDTVKKSMNQDALANLFVGFTTKIPELDDFACNTGEVASTATRQWADEFQKAIRSGNWSDFKKLLQSPLDVPYGPDDVRELVVRQLLGAICYGVAQGDEKAFEQMLDMIPRDVRKSMIQLVKNSPHELDDDHWCEGESERWENFIYGTGRATISRLELSLEADDIGTELPEITPMPAPANQAAS